MDISQYKDYVLVPLLVKCVSDKCAGIPYAPIAIPAGASFQDLGVLKGNRLPVRHESWKHSARSPA